MASRGAVHRRTGGLHPRKTAFDMSHEHKGTCEFGRLIPVMCEEVYPGEFWDLGVQHLIRLHPQVAPLLHEVNITFHDFFIPWRIIWKHWREYITGGATGVEADAKGLTPPVVNIDPNNPSGGSQYVVSGLPGTLWDYIYGNASHYTFTPNNPLAPIDAPLRCYWLIWSEYYRDENFQPRPGESVISNSDYDTDLLVQGGWIPAQRSWTKDYFTSALPFQQRGTAPAFPISISDAPITFDNVTPNVITTGTAFTANDTIGTVRSLGTPGGLGTLYNVTPYALFGNGLNYWQTNNNNYYSLTVGPAKVSHLSEVVSFDVNYLRYAVQIQKILERNARGGVRYNEWLYGHFGDRPRDERLDRPEYIGGAKSSLGISEVLQTSNDAGSSPSGQNTPQGTMAGHAISFSGSRTGKYRVHEHGYIMRIMSIMPTPSYEDGIERMWFRRNRYDHLMPELVNLSEQAILNQEIFATGTLPDKGIWGYQPQYDELRIRRNRVSGELRVNLPVGTPSLGFWHLGRAFSSLPPLGADFIKYDGSNLTDRIMAVSGVHPVIFSVGNVSRAVRPLPYIGEPGLVDHH